MNGQVNRAIVLWENWQEKQAMLEGVFGSGISADLNRQKYDFLSQGINRISASPTPDEKMVLELIKKTTGKLEKQLYPNPVIRTLRRLKSLLYDKPIQSAGLKKLKAENVQALQGTFAGLGLNSDKLNLAKLLDFERQKVDIELVSPYGTGQNFSVKPHLEKDASGQYQLQGYTATLKDPQNPEKNRSFTFSAESGINAREAANLLQGRAVMKFEQIGGNRMASKWVQLDFSSPSFDGKPTLKETSADHEYNLRQEVTKIAEVLNKPELASAKVLNGMEQGNQIALKQVSGETSYLEASPLDKRIMILNDKQQPITLEKLKKQKESALKLKPEKVIAASKKIQVKKKQQQEQFLGIS